MEQPLYCLRGPVVHGRGNGRTVGMPTANLLVKAGEGLPPFGVYAALACVDGNTYIGVTNVGLRPTLHEGGGPTVETMLLDYSGDLYGKEMSLRLYRFLRPTREMGSLSEVRRQVARDAEAARQLLKEIRKES